MTKQFINRWFKFAQRHLDRCEHRSHNIVALILINKKLVSIGWNDTNKTHPKMSELHEHKKLHAELMALGRVHYSHDLSKAQLVVYAQTKAGKQVVAKPCQYCQELIKEAGIKEVIYSNYNGFESYKAGN